MGRSITTAAVLIFTALIITSDFVLAPFVNVKLLDSMVFLAAFLFGFRAGAAVAILSETVWSFVSPWGVAGIVMPFLVGGELLFAAAGWWASKVWEDRSRILNPNSLFIGAVMVLCAFVWDLETNAATALIAYWPAVTFDKLVLTELLGIPFALLHLTADFLLGVLFIPAAILLVPRVMKGKM